jgi:hypothetical protein
MYIAESFFLLHLRILLHIMNTYALTALSCIVCGVGGGGKNSFEILVLKN